MAGRPVSVSEETYRQLEAEAAQSGTIARQKGTSPSGCTLVVVVKPGGGGSSGCGGSCGFLDRIFGRSCQMAGATTGEGVETYCSCSGGWFDKLFRS
jgi:hypothetical protein